MQEIWRSVPGYKGLYEVSNLGGARNPRTGKLLKLTKSRNGYLYINLCKNNTHKTSSIHRLIGITFPDLVGWTEGTRGKPFDELQINHRDKNRTNNHVDNLEWCNAKYNNNYEDHVKKAAIARYKTVYQYTFGGELVREWSSTVECNRNGFNFGHVAACCRGEEKQHKGFLWSYNPPA